jgi:chromate transporter
VNLLRLALACLRVGTFAFGGGFVMVPLLEQYVVGPAPWLTRQQFLDALALGQMTPGPLLVTATFVGYKVEGLLGAAVATVCIFLPSLVMTLAASGQFPRIRGNFYVRRFVRGIEAGIVGLIVAAAVSLGRGSLGSVLQAVLGAAALAVLLGVRKIDSGLVVVGAGVVGLGAKLLGLA